MVAQKTLFGLFAVSSVGAALKSSTPKSQLRNIAASGAVIWAFGGVNGKSGWRSERIWSVRPAAKPSPPNAPTPYIAATPVGRKHTDKVLRLMASDHFDHLALSVTNPEKKPMLWLLPKGKNFPLAASVTPTAKIEAKHSD